MTSKAPQSVTTGAQTHTPLVGVNSVEIFQDLSPAQRSDLGREMQSMQLARGDVLVRQGDIADALYIVVSGRFAVTVDGRLDAVAEIGAGQPIGEIAFLAGGLRTATVTALRDALVLKLGRSQFDGLCAESSSIWQTLTTSMARRLASMNTGHEPASPPQARTIALIPAGAGPLPRAFTEQLLRVFKRSAKVVQISSDTIERDLGARHAIETVETMRALNALEIDNDYVFYVADNDLTPWSKKAIRQADLVLSIGWHDGANNSDVELNECERFSCQVHGAGAHRLVLLHKTRCEITGTSHWLERRARVMHHHVAMDEQGDFERLFRFINGTALGLVACGGGAFCSAHTGIYKALLESGVTFDIMGGTSGGAAMSAGFALGVDPEEIDRQTHKMFVTNKAMGRYTLPVYSLLDHTHFDEQLRERYEARRIEDMWIPYFAISANLSRHELQRHRQGSLWQAIRASSAIPALFPPFYTDEGEMLVDGAVVDNVPVRIMHELKTGPNIVLNFKVPEFERFNVDYNALPPRRSLLAKIVNPLRRQALFQAPSLTAVLMRAMMSNRNEYRQHLRGSDLMLMPPLPEDMSVLDWHRHDELMQLSYHWALKEINGLINAGDQVMAQCCDVRKTQTGARS